MGSKDSVEGFQAGLRGDLLRPDDPRYETARKVYNGMIDRHRPDRPLRDVADVIASVRFARETGMLTAIRGGGHNAGGLGVCDDGLVIDLSAMKGIRVDPRGANRPRRGRLHVGRRGPRHPCVRVGHPLRHHLHHRRRRPDPGGRHRTPDEKVRPDHRQPAGRGPGAGGRPVPHGQRRGEPGPLLGDPGGGGTSASSPRSSSGFIPSTRSMRDPCCGTWSRPPR